jgi:dolichol-phosphate mannosyltransferase
MADDVIRLSICSPVHNERENLAPFVDRVARVMQLLHAERWEQVLVDDGSSDGSAATIEKLKAKHPALVLVRHHTNQGERAAWATAFNAARGQIVVVLAADLQSPPEEIPRLLDAVCTHGYDVATGERAPRKDSAYYRVVSRVLNSYMRLVFQVKVRDSSSSFFAVRSAFVKNMPLVENDHRYILAILARRGARIREIPVAHAPRTAGTSHYSRWKALTAVPELARFTARYATGYYDSRPDVSRQRADA